MQAELGDEIKQVELAKTTRLTRAVIGSYVRGERKGYVPEEVNIICKRAGVRVEKYLAAAGFDVPLTPASEVDPTLEALWPELPKSARDLILGLVQEAARAVRAVRELEPR